MGDRAGPHQPADRRRRSRDVRLRHRADLGEAAADHLRGRQPLDAAAVASPEAVREPGPEALVTTPRVRRVVILRDVHRSEHADTLAPVVDDIDTGSEAERDNVIAPLPRFGITVGVRAACRVVLVSSALEAIVVALKPEPWRQPNPIAMDE